MRASDLVLFGSPLVLGVFGLLVTWLSTRSDRRHRERQRRHGAAE